jgi:hypothetical protein
MPIFSTSATGVPPEMTARATLFRDILPETAALGFGSAFMAMSMREAVYLHVAITDML